MRFVGGGPVRLYYKSSYTGIVLEDAGLARPTSQHIFDPEKIMIEINEQRIPLADADHIVVTVYDDPSGTGQQDAQQFRTNPLWDNSPERSTT